MFLFYQPLCSSSGYRLSRHEASSRRCISSSASARKGFLAFACLPIKRALCSAKAAGGSFGQLALFFGNKLINHLSFGRACVTGSAQAAAPSSNLRISYKRIARQSVGEYATLFHHIQASLLPGNCISRAGRA